MRPPDETREDPIEVDAFGLACPQPIIALARTAAGLPAGARLDLLSDDAAADADVPA